MSRNGLLIDTGNSLGRIQHVDSPPSPLAHRRRRCPPVFLPQPLPIQLDTRSPANSYR